MKSVLTIIFNSSIMSIITQKGKTLEKVSRKAIGPVKWQPATI